ncbi:triose-phosphate isomerase [Myxococcota bacterium]|nr:triose-phosphate isomerase [Myxococcota bacterium]MBU1380141.1 triose-phosphate isomerase [Myxococcota bacterium]MBU1497105.1 triose-phosphate isomerase [Myxococcota bacterium]
MARTFHIYGNWKLNKNASESAQLALETAQAAAVTNGKVKVAVAPVFTNITTVRSALGSTSHVNLLAQNGYPKASGAFTGEVSFALLKDAGCDGVIIGHSERRQIFGETNEFIADKVQAAAEIGLQVVLCCGETLDEREAGKTWEIVEKQLTVGLSKLPENLRSSVIIAYEPVWAIGTGKTASPDQAQEIHALIRKLLGTLWTPSQAAEVIIQYGGSVNESNALELFRKEDIDGALVGGAALKVDSFSKIIQAAFEVSQ